MAVHVWRDGDYLGLIAKGGRDTLGISPDSDELRRALDTLLAQPPISDTGGIERFGSKPVRFLEFPKEDWLDVAAVLFLPPAGFRVHVISGPGRDELMA
jgi:hypothetical protein